MVERRRKRRFPVNFELHYVAEWRKGSESGLGRAVDLSSSGLSFHADRRLRPQQTIWVAMDWPARLDGNIPLQLVIAGKIIRTEGTLTVLRFNNHEFRTRRLADPASANGGAVAARGRAIAAGCA